MNNWGAAVATHLERCVALDGVCHEIASSRSVRQFDHVSSLGVVRVWSLVDCREEGRMTQCFCINYTSQDESSAYFPTTVSIYLGTNCISTLFFPHRSHLHVVGLASRFHPGAVRERHQHTNVYSRQISQIQHRLRPEERRLLDAAAADALFPPGGR